MTAEIGHNGGPAMDVLNGTAQSQLRGVFERVERLIEDRKAVNEDIKEVLAEAKGNGFDVAIIRKVLQIRAMDQAKRQEQEALIDLYMTATGGAPAFEPQRAMPAQVAAAPDFDPDEFA